MLLWLCVFYAETSRLDNVKLITKLGISKWWPYLFAEGLDESNHAPNLGRRHSSGDIPVISPTYFKDTMHETILPSINENDGEWRGSYSLSVTAQ